jgi:hypothetical protein
MEEETLAEWIDEQGPAPIVRRSPVENVRLLRDVVFWSGWFVLVVGLVLLVAPLVMNSGAELRGEPLVLYLMGRIYGVLLPPLLVLCAWGALTMLCEIHDRLEDQNDILEGKNDLIAVTVDDDQVVIDDEQRWRR